MARNIYEVFEWAKAKGDKTALLRLRLKMLSLSAREGIVLEHIRPETTCSSEYLSALRAAAAEIVGQPLP